MNTSRRSFLMAGSALAAGAFAAPKALAALPAADRPIFELAVPMAPPEWALLERAVLDAHTAACEAFFDRYFDERGFLLEHERWGGDDGPDDAIENVNDWPQLYALGASERVRQMYEKAYEGHVRQYTLAHTTEVPFARDGMYFREFPVMMDWQHNGEGLTVFNNMGLGDPYNKRYRDRVRRFAGFYIGEDASAPNYDKQHKIIRSMFNGSRGPLMRKATGLDWAGDPIDTSGVDQNSLLHGEHSYEQMVAHFKDYNDTTGDNPLNLEATGLALNAYMLEHEPKYRDWIIEYVDAWVDRARRNNDMIPTNIGYDGTIGGEAGGKWYGGVYGWAFSPVVPQTGKRDDRNRIPFCLLGFLNAYMITGDDKYLDVWRRMTDHINANAKVIDGKLSAPTMYGDNGWYSYKPGKWLIGSQDIYYLTMKPSDRARAPDNPWLSFIEGKNPGYPQVALRSALERIRNAHAALLSDQTTPDTRFADTMMDQNPASVTALIELMEGGIHIGRPGWSRLSPGVGGALQFTRFRYFDPVARRAGIPQDVAALVETLAADGSTLTLVNTNQSEGRTVVIQGGAYGEHQIVSVSDGKSTQPVSQRFFTVRLAPGAGARLSVRMQRFANQPTLDFPWAPPIVDGSEQYRRLSAQEQHDLL
ncbi:hypothetical protein [Sphingomonas crusticola]|uniref:hypothetical protein n=1 Tax=Sphingomonas crusticola TaxID=1697973 RepID=UPI0019678081|nr:hypothetical protein [Sphingomonas crusticola]